MESHPFSERGSPDTPRYGVARRAECCGYCKDAFRIAFGVVWLIDGFFKWRPGFHAEFLSMVQRSGQGQPSWLHWFYTFTNNVITPHPHVWAYGVAALETLIGLALIFGFARKLTYIIAAITGVGIWAVAEGFGGPYNSGSTDIGAAVMYTVVALGLLALNYEGGTSRLSVDYYLEQRIPWWHRIAEVQGRRRKQAPAAQDQQPVTQAPATS